MMKLLILAMCVAISVAIPPRRLSTRKPTSGPAVAPAAPVAPKAATCGVSQVQADDLWTPGAKIVGGVKAAEDSWPWICALVQNKPGFYPYQFCGATIIASHWIITASHCVETLSESEMIRNVRVVCGSNDLKYAFYDKPTQFVYNISRKIMHEEYDIPEGSTNNDVALLKLSRPVQYARNVQPICLPTGPMEDHTKAANIDKERDNRRVGFVAGWGHQKEGQETDILDPKSPKIGAGSDQLLQVNIDLYKFSECLQQLHGYEFTEKMACGGFAEGGKDSCQGDSGGPLISKNTDGFFELIGVVSWGAGCARPGMPGIYANLWNLKSWITDKVNKN